MPRKKGMTSAERAYHKRKAREREERGMTGFTSRKRALDVFGGGALRRASYGTQAPGKARAKRKARKKKK